MTRQNTSHVNGAVIDAADINSLGAALNKTMQLMTPTSVSTGSIGTYGAVTISAASAVSINGCFTSEFDWYEVIFDLTTSASATIGAALRLSGTDASTAFDIQRTAGVNGTATTTQALNASTWRFTGTGLAGRHSGTARLFGPAIAAQTTGTIVAGGSANPMTTSDASTFNAFISHRTATAYDGITLTPSSGNITGTIRVYGII